MVKVWHLEHFLILVDQMQQRFSDINRKLTCKFLTRISWRLFIRTEGTYLMLRRTLSFHVPSIGSQWRNADKTDILLSWKIKCQVLPQNLPSMLFRHGNNVIFQETGGRDINTEILRVRTVLQKLSYLQRLNQEGKATCSGSCKKDKLYLLIRVEANPKSVSP